MNRPVIAAIPNYNMAESLRRLLPQVLTETYDAVYVLDDHSTDDSVAVARSFPGVTVKPQPFTPGCPTVAGCHHTLHRCRYEPRKPTHPNALRHIFEDSKIGVAGGLVYEQNGLQSPYNFGPRISFAWISALIPQVVTGLQKHSATA